MKQIQTIALLIATLTVAAFGGNNTLKVVKTSPTSAAIELSNTDVVAGMQFSIRSSSNVLLQEPERSGRTLSSEWTVASYKVSDTLVNVVIISLRQQVLDAGAGAILEFTFAETRNADESAITLTGVKVANPRAEKVDVEVEELRWSTSKPVAATFELGPNFPNPFNPTTRISYKLSKPAYVTLSVYDMTGREIDRLVDGHQEAGQFTAVWNTEQGSRVYASGIYFARLTVEGKSMTQKMILTK